MTRALSTPPVIASGSLGDCPQPVLPAAGSLLLRPWEEADAPAFLSAYQDDEIRRWHTRRPASEAEALEWFHAYRQDWKREKGGHWAITRDGEEVLGRLALRGLDLDDGVAEVAYWVLPAARGAGVATHGLAALTAWALNEIGFHRLELDHSTRNHASCRVATKSGYLLEGTKRSAAVHDDGRHDMHLHARIREGRDAPPTPPGGPRPNRAPEPVHDA
ncbi:GNAT family N-acetyltransferase [Streptomyces anandii]|uniref:GNAT family N-acetyltransferase n=1 Tax=Streptomyces anandii TaxID=285454 RepID=UPI001673C22E|nr:GNAT family N-acetyltransferase [Streptomyces anandii]GGY08311.1 acetyltransferase [Streptomyces anandii JCM 4720]